MAVSSATDISRRIEAEITSGTLSAGEALPSIRAFAGSIGASPTTVAAAYRRLRDRGLVVGKGRQGTRVAPRRGPDPRGNSPMPAGLVDAISGNPDPGSIPNLERVLVQLDPAPPARYGDALLHPALEGPGRALFDADGVDSSHLTVTAGAMHAIELIMSTEQFRVGDRLGVEDPGHIPVHHLGRRIGMELVGIDVDSEGMLPDSLRSALRTGLSAVILSPRAHNPTGAALTARRSAELATILADHSDTMVIQDDHAGAVAGDVAHMIEPHGPRWAVIRSLGKSLGPDLRVALVAGDRLTIDRIEAGVAASAGWISHILQRAAGHLLADPDTAELVASAAALYRHRRERLLSRLGEHGVGAAGASGLNVWIPVGDEQGAIEAAREAGFAIRGGGPYRLSSSPAVRVTITALTDGEIDRLALALGRHLGGTGNSPRM